MIRAYMAPADFAMIDTMVHVASEREGTYPTLLRIHPATVEKLAGRPVAERGEYGGMSEVRIRGIRVKQVDTMPRDVVQLTWAAE